MDIETILKPHKKAIIQACGKDEYILKDYFRDGEFAEEFADKVTEEEADFITNIADTWDCVEFILK